MKSVSSWLGPLSALSLYTLGHFLFHVVSPLGLAPVLDARENLVLAERIVAGELPAEPFYRAMGYPLLLAGLKFVLPGIPLAVGGSLVGLLLHWLNAWLVGKLARLVWRDERAAWFAGALYAVYPVSLYFAVQLFDITLGISIFLGAIVLWMGAQNRRGADAPAEWRLPLAGLLLGCAVLVRPHFLIPALVVPVIAIFWRAQVSGGTTRSMLRRGWGRGLLIATPLLAVLIGQGLLNLKLGGEFRVLPWQGAYNFHAANREGANGRYFVQKVFFSELPPGANPTRLESEILYRHAAGAEADASISTMNAHWRDAALDRIREQPVDWLSLMGRKLVYLLNDWEQYNNLTYAFHREQSPWLRWNPLGWGVLMMLGGLGVSEWFLRTRNLPMRTWKDEPSHVRSAQSKDAMSVSPRRSGDVAGVVVILLLGLSYAVGVILYFASARFRLPLTPLLAVLAGGVVPLGWAVLQSRSRRLVAACAATLLAIACLVYPNWLGSRDRSTFIQDHVLMASAAMERSHDALALEHAEAAVELDPMRRDAIQLAMLSRFNLLFTGQVAERPEDLARLLEFRERLKDTITPAIEFVTGVAEWKTGEQEAAVERWREQVRLHGDAALSSAKALQAVGAEHFFERDDPEMQRLRLLLQPQVSEKPDTHANAFREEPEAS